MSYPVLIIARDRLTYLVNLIEWLEDAGYGDQIHIIDNKSTYPPLLEYYRKTQHTVWRCDDNRGPFSPWEIKQLRQLRESEYFVVTDHDLYPQVGCPKDLIDRCKYILDEMPDVDKVGPSLEIYDFPETATRGKAAFKWESGFWNSRLWIPEYECFESSIDTTFALHRPGTEYKLTECIRLGRPYVFKHLPWYLDYDNLDEENQYYTDNLDPGISNWSRARLPDHLQNLMKDD